MSRRNSRALVLAKNLALVGMPSTGAVGAGLELRTNAGCYRSHLVPRRNFLNSSSLRFESSRSRFAAGFADLLFDIALFRLSIRLASAASCGLLK